MPMAYLRHRGYTRFCNRFMIDRLLTSVVGEITRHIDDYQYREQYCQYNADDHPRAKAVGVRRLQRCVYAWKQRRKRIFYYQSVSCTQGRGRVNSLTTGAFKMMLSLIADLIVPGYRMFRLIFCIQQYFDRRVLFQFCIIL